MTDANLQRIRDLISGHPLQDELLADSESWNKLCNALDQITDEPTIDGRIEALNDVRSALGMDPTPEAERSEPALVAGLATVRTELEDRAEGHFASFRDQPLSALFHQRNRYNIEKAVEAITRGGAYRRAMGVDPLRDLFSRLNDGIKARGYDETVRSNIEDGLYILERADAFLDRAPRAPAQRDIELLVATALPELLARARELAEEIDAESIKPHGGWSV